MCSLLSSHDILARGRCGEGTELSLSHGPRSSLKRGHSQMKQNLCVKISYKKYLLANTSFPQPVVLQYTSGDRKSLEPECGIATLRRPCAAAHLDRSKEPRAHKGDAENDEQGR